MITGNEHATILAKISLTPQKCSAVAAVSTVAWAVVSRSIPRCVSTCASFDSRIPLTQSCSLQHVRRHGWRYGRRPCRRGWRRFLLCLWRRWWKSIRRRHGRHARRRWRWTTRPPTLPTGRLPLLSLGSSTLHTTLMHLFAHPGYPTCIRLPHSKSQELHIPSRIPSRAFLDCTCNQLVS